MAKPSWWDVPITIKNETLTPFNYLSAHWTFLTDSTIASILTEARSIPVTVSTVSLKRRRSGLHKTPSGLPRIFEESEHRRFDEAPTLVTDDVLVLADVESPFHDANWCSEVVALAAHWHIPTVVLAGDFFHFESLSPFSKQLLASRTPYGFPDDYETELSDEVETTAKFGDVLLQNFSEIHLIMGNHERRLTRRLTSGVRIDLLRHLLGYRKEANFNVYPYYYLDVRSCTGMWRISHPGNVSVIPVRVASRLADKYRINYVAAHGHDVGWTTSASGYYAAATGCCVDPHRLAYRALRDNLRPEMQQGAFILHEGQPILLHPRYNPPTRFLKEN